MHGAGQGVSEIERLMFLCSIFQAACDGRAHERPEAERPTGLPGPGPRLPTSGRAEGREGGTELSRRSPQQYKLRRRYWVRGGGRRGVPQIHPAGISLRDSPRHIGGSLPAAHRRRHDAETRRRAPAEDGAAAARPCVIFQCGGNSGSGRGTAATATGR